MDGGVTRLAAQATEVEQPVDGALELEGPGLTVLVVLGDLAQPVRAHLHVGDLVGEHPVLAEPQHRVGDLLGEVAHRGEDIDGEAFERPVHAGQAEHRIGMARRFEQRDALGVLADLTAHVLAELEGDLAVASLVPALAGHVELHREGDRAIGAVARFVVERGAPGAFERLDLADEDAVHLAAGAVGDIVGLGVDAAVLAGGGPLVGEPLGCRQAVEPGIAGESGRGQLLAHAPSVRRGANGVTAVTVTRSSEAGGG